MDCFSRSEEEQSTNQWRMTLTGIRRWAGLDHKAIRGLTSAMLCRTIVAAESLVSGGTCNVSTLGFAGCFLNDNGQLR